MKKLLMMLLATTAIVPMRADLPDALQGLADELNNLASELEDQSAPPLPPPSSWQGAPSERSWAGWRSSIP